MHEFCSINPDVDENVKMHILHCKNALPFQHFSFVNIFNCVQKRQYLMLYS